MAFARESIGGNPGTTLILAIISGSRASVANVGDSRVYLVSSSGVTQVTEDHSWAAGQVRLGALDAEAARHHPKRNLIERAVMGDPVEADIFDVDAAAGMSSCCARTASGNRSRIRPWVRSWPRPTPSGSR